MVAKRENVGVVTLASEGTIDPRAFLVSLQFRHINKSKIRNRIYTFISRTIDPHTVCVRLEGSHRVRSYVQAHPPTPMSTT